MAIAICPTCGIHVYDDPNTGPPGQTRIDDGECAYLVGAAEYLVKCECARGLAAPQTDTCCPHLKQELSRVIVWAARVGETAT
jgi:hypothetical protein